MRLALKLVNSTDKTFEKISRKISTNTEFYACVKSGKKLEKNYPEKVINTRIYW